MKKDTDDLEDNTEKCTICLSEFEDFEDVRQVHFYIIVVIELLLKMFFYC